MSAQPSPYGYYDPAPSAPLRSPICVIGFMGSESHMIAALCSSLTGHPLIDLDDWVEHEAGVSLAELYRTRGASAWRALELKGLQRALSASRPSIIALGDGALLPTEARLLQRSAGALVYIKRPLASLYEGLLKERSAKPSRFPYWSRRAPQGTDELEPLLSARSIAYEQAELVLDAGGDVPLKVAQRLAERLNQLA